MSGSNSDLAPTVNDAAAASPSTIKAPGKRPRTVALPPGGREMAMSGVPFVDNDLYCDTPAAGGDPGCFLDDRQAANLLQLIGIDAVTVGQNFLTALGNVRMDLLTKHASGWGGLQEVAFMLITGALTGPLVGAIAGSVLSVARATKVVTTAFRGLRTALAHRGVKSPATKVQFIDYLQTLLRAFPQNVLTSISEDQLDHDGMLALHDSLINESVVGVPAITERVNTLLLQFDANRLGEIGQQPNGLEAAQPIWVTFKGHRYLVLTESFGHRNMATALTGANIDKPAGTPEMTLESLIYVRIVEPAFHHLMVDEYRGRREADPPLYNFDVPVVRNQARWFGDFYVDLMHRVDAPKLVVADGDAGDDR